MENDANHGFGPNNDADENDSQEPEAEWVKGYLMPKPAEWEQKYLDCCNVNKNEGLNLDPHTKLADTVLDHIDPVIEKVTTPYADSSKRIEEELQRADLTPENRMKLINKQIEVDIRKDEYGRFMIKVAGTLGALGMFLFRKR